MTSFKMKPQQIDMAERVLTKCYFLNGVTYVPHRKYSGFAYPAMTKNDLPISAVDLMKAGAKIVEEWIYGSTSSRKK
jgi:hypothetical protein